MDTRVASPAAMLAVPADSSRAQSSLEEWLHGAREDFTPLLILVQILIPQCPGVFTTQSHYGTLTFEDLPNPRKSEG